MGVVPRLAKSLRASHSRCDEADVDGRSSALACAFNMLFSDKASGLFLRATEARALMMV